MCQCEPFGDSINLEIKLTPYLKSGLLAIRYVKCQASNKSFIYLWANIGTPTSLFSLVFVAIGVGTILQSNILNIFNTYFPYFNAGTPHVEGSSSNSTIFMCDQTNLQTRARNYDILEMVSIDQDLPSTSMRSKYLIHSKSIISNSFFMVVLDTCLYAYFW